MTYRSLREFITKLESERDLVRVREPVSTVLEMTEIQTRLLAERGPAVQQAGGFWTGVSNDDKMAGTNYCTAMAVLSLTVEYRFLPIYQRGEEPEERAGK